MCDRRLLAVALLILCGFAPGFAQQVRRNDETLRIAAAADLQPLLPAVLSAFQQQTGIRTEASYQSSATLATQIINGAPFDLFLAADLGFPQRVIDAGRAEEARPVPYARGTLVLWTRNDSGVATLSLEALRGSTIRSIAVANAQHAPYGRAAQAALEHAALLAVVRSKLVVAENIAQAAQYADSGNAQVGFISLTSALTPRLKADGHFIRVAAEDYPPLLQGAVVIRRSAGADLASRFLAFLKGPEVAKTLDAEGLAPVDQAASRP